MAHHSVVRLLSVSELQLIETPFRLRSAARKASNTVRQDVSVTQPAVRPEFGSELVLSRSQMAKAPTSTDKLRSHLLRGRRCLWGKWAKKALDDKKIHYRVGYSTRNHNGTIAMVGAGLAVSVLSRGTVPPQFRILTEADGFPALPLSKIGLVVGPKGLSPVSQRLADAVRQSLTAPSIAA